MRITEAPAVLRAAGIEVVEHSGWRTRSNGELSSTLHWVWHHDASNPGDSPGVPAYMIGNYRKAGAQLWVDRRGRWHIIATGVAYHAGKVRGSVGNSNSVGIETDHTTGESWPSALLDSLRKGTAALIRHYGGGADRLHFHKSICAPVGRKNDPDGLDLGAERARVAALLAGGTPTIDSDLLRRGSSGDAVTALQRRLVEMGHAITVDGDFGPATEAAVRAAQAELGVADDGIVGPATDAALKAWDPALTLVEIDRDLGDTARPGAIFTPGARLTCDGYQFVLQGDGNAVVYDADRRPLWATGARGDQLILQADGNLVLYRAGRAVWSSETVGAVDRLQLQADGNLVVYGALWATGTQQQARPLKEVR